MTTNKTLIIDDAVPYAKEIYSHLGKVITLPGREIDRKAVMHADALIVRSRTQVNANLLQGTSIKFVGSTVVGLDHIDQDYLKKKQIHFYSAQGCNANSVAEYIITALFNLAEEFGFELSDKTLGIIGVGNVGGRLYNKAELLGIDCLLNDPPKLQQQPELAEKYPYVPLEQCLQADIITVHTPLTDRGEFPTVDLISAKHLQRIRPEQIIINAARGGIINEDQWIKTPTQANIIDCWENEPNINEALYNSAWIATPHIAGHSLDAKVAGSSMVYEELCRYWQTPPEDQWRQSLPSSPNPLKIADTGSIQSKLNQLFSQTHNIFHDDRAIRDKNIQNIHKKYEYYRRNFPIYREWHQHRVLAADDQTLNNLLKSLGFPVIAEENTLEH